MSDLAAIAERAIREFGAVQQAYELAGLLELVNPGDIAVEIGCDAGGVLWAFREAGAGEVIGVDLPKGRYSSGKPLTEHGAHIIAGDSHDATVKRKLQRHLDGRQIDLLLIDADHTYKGVKTDWQMYGPLVRPGGLIAFHDICHHNHNLFPEVQVERLWWELKAKFPDATREIIYRVRPWATGMGIGVLTHG